MRIGIVALTALMLSGVASEAGYAYKVAAAGKPLQLYWATSVNPDCSSAGAVTMKVAEPPSHGRVTISRTGVFPNFSAMNVRQRCNTRRVAGVKAFYTSRRGYQGPDRVAIDVIWPTGRYLRHDVSIAVR
jgi:hypothetical protein